MTTTPRRSRAALVAGALFAAAALAAPAAAALHPDQPATGPPATLSALGPENIQKKHLALRHPFQDVNVRKAVIAGFDRQRSKPTP